MSQPAITFSDLHHGDWRIGTDLQKRMRVNLGGADHGGVDVLVSSSVPGVLLVSPDTSTPGSTSISIHFNDGDTQKTFYIQGVSESVAVDTTESAILTANQALFTTGTATITVTPLVFDIISLAATTTTLSSDDPFYVRCGYIHSNGTNFHHAPASATGGPLAVSVSSSNAVVGQLTTSSGSGSSMTVNIPVNGYDTPSSVASGGIAFDPLSVGTTTMTASALGSNAAFGYSNQAVTVNQTAITFSDLHHGDWIIGGGLQKTMRVTLNGSAHGGVTIRIASTDTVRLLVSPDATTVGTSFIDVFIPNGETYKNFYIHGISGDPGTVPLTGTSTGLASASANIQVVKGVLDILYLITSTSAGAADDPFVIRTGYPNGTSFRYCWVSATENALQVIIKSSDALVGQLITGTGTGDEETIEIQAGQYDSASTVATGGVAFDPIAAGTTEISTTAIGFDNTWSQSSATVTVSP